MALPKPMPSAFKTVKTSWVEEAERASFMSWSWTLLQSDRQTEVEYSQCDTRTLTRAGARLCGDLVHTKLPGFNIYGCRNIYCFHALNSITEQALW